VTLLTEVGVISDKLFALLGDEPSYENWAWYALASFNSPQYRLSFFAEFTQPSPLERVAICGIISTKAQWRPAADEFCAGSILINAHEITGFPAIMNFGTKHAAAFSGNAANPLRENLRRRKTFVYCQIRCKYWRLASFVQTDNTQPTSYSQTQWPHRRLQTGAYRVYPAKCACLWCSIRH